MRKDGRNKRVLGLLCGLLLITFYSCDDNVVFEANEEINNAEWSSDQNIQFRYQVSDTVTLHNHYINLRNGDEYPYMNIFLFVSIDFPNGRRSLDTLECFLANNKGEWLGSGLGDIYDNRFLMRSKPAAFPIPGEYSITIRHAMREDTIPAIYDVGYRLSRIDP